MGHGPGLDSSESVWKPWAGLVDALVIAGFTS